MRTIRAVLMFVILMQSAHAIPVVWTIDGTFDDGEFFSGTLTYDADTSIYSDVNITTTQYEDFLGAGFFVSGTTFSFQEGQNDTSPYFYVILGTPYPSDTGIVSDRELTLYFNDLLPAEGGVVSIFAGSEYFYSNYYGYDDNRQIVSGTATASVVPLPPALWLFGSALAGTGWLRRKLAK